MQYHVVLIIVWQFLYLDQIVHGFGTLNTSSVDRAQAKDYLSISGSELVVRCSRRSTVADLEKFDTLAESANDNDHEADMSSNDRVHKVDKAPFSQSLESHRLDMNRTLKIVYRFHCPRLNQYARVFRARARFLYTESRVQIDRRLNIQSVWDYQQFPVDFPSFEYAARMSAERCIHFRNGSGRSCVYKFSGRFTGYVNPGNVLMGVVIGEEMTFAFIQDPHAPPAVAPSVTEQCHRIVDGGMVDLEPRRNCQVNSVDVTLVVEEPESDAY